MKNATTKENARDDVYELISEGLGISSALVRKICCGIRKDHHRVLKAVRIVREHKALSREKLMRKLAKLKPVHRKA